MKKQIVLGLAALGTAVAMLPLFAAFEAHVINVTARIENALNVPVDPITFGTVFPQEHLDKHLKVALSKSFDDERRVDDVEYIIRQKPKCGVTSQNGQVLDGPTWTGHVVPTLDDPATLGVDESNGGTAYTIDCKIDMPNDLILGPGQNAGLLPMLCPYISKHPDMRDDQGGSSTNDGKTDSFHKPFEVIGGQIVWHDTDGRLAKSENDRMDDWTIDLAVPCFGGYCAQDWEDFVRRINPNALPANQWTQPIENEHKVFGCNLWIEVTGVSEDID